MRIRRIEIANFRKLVGPVALDGLGDGLTVIAGDNEDGKSTVLAALRSVFFDRYSLSGDGAKAMQPFGSTLRPEIAVDFQFEGERYALRKAFCQGAAAELRCASGAWSGPAVEEELQKLMRFTPPGRGPSGPEHRGVHGMFWIEQGTAFRGVGANLQGRRTLLGALEGEVGQVLGGERGRRLSARIREAYLEFFTEKEGRPRGLWKTAAADVEKLADEAAKLGAEAAAFDEAVDRLERLRERIERRERDGALERAAAARASAEKAAALIDDLVRHAETARSAVEIAAAQRDMEMARWQERERTATAAERDAAEAGKAAEAARAAAAERASFAERLPAAREAAAAAGQPDAGGATHEPDSSVPTFGH
jgi:DNA repair exonuclease SbcCD ATPase subunit